MSDLERDDLVARALRDLPVPPHRPGFWDDLDAAVTAAPGRGVDGDERLDTGQLPVVTSLEERRHRRSLAPVLVAAAVLVLLGAVGFVTLAGDGDDGGGGGELADQPLGTDATGPAESGGTGSVETFATSEPQPATTAATEPTGDDDSPEAVVTAWIDALATGDAAGAAALVGPRSVAYLEALGADVEGFMRESQEGYGPWADVEDRTITVLGGSPLAFDGGELQVVVLTGTHPGEGEPATRVEVLPLVDDGEGFKVEHLAFDPDRDNDPVFTLPAETERGLGRFAPEDEINVFVPADGTVYFQVDDGEVGSDETSEVAGDPFALYDPPGALTRGEHTLVLVAVGTDGTIAHFGGTFTVD